MKLAKRIKWLLLIILIWIMGIFSVQLYQLPQLKEQVRAGLEVGLEEINLDLARELSREYEQALKQAMQSELRRAKLSPSISTKKTSISLSQHPFILSFDVANSSWEFSPKEESLNFWQQQLSLQTQIINRLNADYRPWEDSLNLFWSYSIDSTLTYFLKDNPFDPTERIALQPFFDKATASFLGFLGILLSESYVEEKFFPQFFKKYLFSEEWKRSDGIQKAYLHILLKDENGRKVYDSEPTIREIPSTRLPLSEASFYWDGYQLELGFLGNDAEAIAKSLYQRNIWLLSLVFGFLILLLIVLYFTQVQAQKLERLKREFLANMGHELKTPLSSIKLAAEGLKLGRIKDEGQRKLSLDIIEQETQRLERKVRHLMDFARLEVGKRGFKKERLNVEFWGKAWFAKKAIILQESGFRLHMTEKISKGFIEIDPEALVEVMDILLDNAQKYSGGKRDIFFEIEEISSDICISLEDQGIGIPQDRQAEVFDKFVRAVDLDRHEVKGDGLGLAIAKSLVEAQGGKISLRSRPAKGSRFSLIFPTA
ncbi:MAG: HAMP domain-containing sensor histidine kinase [Bacteroidota bacterium]